MSGRAEFDGGQSSILASPRLTEWPDDVLAWVANRIGVMSVAALPDEKRQALEPHLDTSTPAQAVPLPVYDGEPWACAKCRTDATVFYGFGDHLCIVCWVDKYEPGDPAGRLPVVAAPPDPLGLMVEYCHRVWQEDEGWACLGHGVPQSDRPGEHYAHTGFRHDFWRWPDDQQALYDFALAHRDVEDVYVCPVLRTKQACDATTTGHSWHVFGEVDHPWTGELEARFVDLAEPGSFTVRSGGHGRHLYFKLDEPIDRDVLEDMNRRLDRTFDGGHKSSGAAFLRLPGTFHHKRRVWYGEEPVLVDFGTRVGER